LHMLGLIAHQVGQNPLAVELIGRAIAANPSSLMHANLGIVLRTQGRLAEAADSLQKAVSLQPDFAEAYNNLGTVLQALGKLEAAAASFRNAAALQPDFAEAHNNLGLALQHLGQLDAAANCYDKTLALRPDLAETHYNLGNVLKDQGHLDKAIASFKNALALKPDFAKAYSNLLFLYGYQSQLEPEEYLSLARGWELACVPANDRDAARLRSFRRDSPSGRRLRIGYVSGDFRQHAMSYFIEQLFNHHDRRQIELFAYSTSNKCDAITERLATLVDHWISIAGISDSAALERIESDGIDVLIDLTGHTAHDRLGIFARRAAPVQVHYLGYFASTGLTEMDYLIGDETLTPTSTDLHFSELVWRLPRIRASYAGRADAPEPAWQPDREGRIWLGSFNNLGKLTPETLSLWAKVLHVLPEGRLLLKTNGLSDVGNRQRILDTLSSQGIASDRVELQSDAITPGWPDHMAYYDRLDIALDPIGAHGGYTTTCDALWMAVPVVTLIGARMASRMTASILDAIGHAEWIAHSEEEYIATLVALARDVDRRKSLRRCQRERMAQSLLCDAKDLAMTLEQAYREMFLKWFEQAI